MKVRLYLKKKGKGPHPVYVALYSDTPDLTQIIYTGEKCGVEDWSKPEGSPKQGSKSNAEVDQRRKELFSRVKHVESALLKVKRLMEAEGTTVTPYSLKKRYEDTQHGKLDEQRAKDRQDKTNAVTISSLIDNWIKTGLGNWQPSTQKVVRTSIKTFQTYLKINGLRQLERKELTLDLINEYATYLQDKKKLRDSTHAKKMKHLRWFLKSIKFDNSQIKEIKLRTVKPAERNIIALSSDELIALENVDVSASKEQQKAKDMFLLGCYTGLRISDLKRISRPRIDMITKRLTMVLQKNKKLVTIPLINEAYNILSRYNWSAPKIAEQQLNESIKVVCDKAGIKEPTLFKSKKAGKLEEIAYAKHELITSHCAGKTFICLAIKKWGLTPVDIAAIVGKDVKTVMGYYLKPDQQEAIDKMEKAETAKHKAKMKIV